MTSSVSSTPVKYEDVVDDTQVAESTPLSPRRFSVNAALRDAMEPYYTVVPADFSDLMDDFVQDEGFDVTEKASLLLFDPHKNTRYSLQIKVVKLARNVLIRGHAHLFFSSMCLAVPISFLVSRQSVRMPDDDSRDAFLVSEIRNSSLLSLSRKTRRCTAGSPCGAPTCLLYSTLPV